MKLLTSMKEINDLMIGLTRERGEPGDLEGTLRSIVTTAIDLFSTDICAIFAVNPITGKFIWPPIVEGELRSEEQAILEQPRPDGLTYRILNQDAIMLVDDLGIRPESQTSFLRAEGIRSFVAVALRTELDRKPLAVLYLDSREPHHFTSEEETTLRLLADHASRVLQNTWFIRRYREIVRIGQDINQELTTVDILFKKLHEHISGILNTRCFFSLLLYHPETGTRDLYMFDEGEYKFSTGKPLTGLSQWVVENQKSLLVRDYGIEKDELPVEPRYIKGTGIGEKSLVFVPLVLRGVPLGVLSIQHNQPNAYGGEDLYLLQLIGNHVASALSNLRLFYSLRRLNETGQFLTRQLDSEQVLPGVAEWIRETTQADIAVLYPYVQASRQFQFPPNVSGTFLVPEFPQPSFSRPDDIASLTLKQSQPVFAKDSSELYAKLGGDPGPRMGNFEQREKIRSTAALPLRVGDEKVGVLFVNYRQPQRFDAPQKQLIEGLASYAAIAIKNSRELQTLTRRHVAELELLREIDRELNRSLDPKQVMNTMLVRASAHISADGASVLLYNSRTKTLEPQATFGRHDQAGGLQKIPLDQVRGITRWVFEHRTTARVDNVLTQPPWRDMYIQLDSATRSELDVPLRDDGEVIGVINFESSCERAFSQADQDFIETLAGQAVLAIKNARAYERERRLAEERQTLIGIGREITAQLDSTKLLGLILEGALQVTEATAGNLMLYDPLGHDLWMAAERGVEQSKKGRRQRLDEGIVGWVATNREPLCVDVCKPPWNEVYVSFIPGMCSELAAPMLEGVQKQLRGVINIEHSHPEHFDEDDERLLTALADLAVIALQNTERLEKAETSARKLRALHDVDREVIRLTDDPDQAMRVILKNGVLLTNAEEGDLHLYEHGSPSSAYFATRAPTDQVLIISRVDAVDPAANKIERGIITHVAEKKKTYVTQGDAQADPFFVGDTNVHSEVTVPLLLGDEDLIGVLNLESTQPYAFQEADVEILELLAGQAAIAIHNVRDHTRAEAEAKRFSLLNQAGQELGGISDLAQIDRAYDIVIRIAREQSESQQTVIRRYDESTQELVAVRSEHTGSAPPFARMRIDEGLSGQVYEEHRTIVVPDADNPSPAVRLKRSDKLIKSLLITPVQFEDHYYGTLGLSHRAANHFKGADVELFEGLAHQLALTIHRLETVQAQQEAEQRARAAEVMSSIGQSATELAHRLGNELGLVRSYVNNIETTLAKQSSIPPTVGENLGNIVQDVGRVLELSKGLRDELAKSREMQLEPTDLLPEALLAEATRSLPSLPSNVQVSLDIRPDAAAVRADYRLVSDILRNLFVNAIEAMPDGGTITLRACNVGRQGEIQIADTGTGIPSDRQKRVFDLFYSTKGSFGFGLWSARRNALVNGGDLIVNSEVGKGSVFTLMLPRADFENGG
jgi:GAF domain-containing protein